MNFVDTHVHLHFPEFESDLKSVIDRAQTAGVRSFINVGTDLESSRQAVALAERYEFVYATVGIHPHDVKEAAPEAMDELTKLAKHAKVVAVGEVGLDFFSPNKAANPTGVVADRNLSPESVQRNMLIQFFEMAKQVSLPLVLHIRDAYQEMIELLKTHFKPPIRAVSHCFSGTPDAMQKLIDLGLYISFAGPVSYKKNDSLREAAKVCPRDRILVETDAPFLAPQAHRGKRNEPAFMIETARLIADLRGTALEEFGALSSRNAEALFGIPRT